VAQLGGESEAQRGESLGGFVVQLASPAGPFLLGRREPLPASLGLDRLGGGDRGRRAGGECLQQPLILGGERGAVAQPVDGDQYPMR
jgi:hypothetical protein